MIKFLKELFDCCKSKKNQKALIVNEESRNNTNTNRPNIEIIVQQNGYENCNVNESTKKDLSSCIENGLIKQEKTEVDDKLEIEINDDSKQILIPDKYIRDEERDKIVFSKEGLFRFYEELNNDSLNWNVLYSKGSLKISSKMGSPISSNVLLIKTSYTLNKSSFKGHKNITLSFLAKMMYEPEMRMAYDKSFKEYRIVERFNEYAYIFYSWINSFISVASERDVKDKRLEFIYKEMYFNFSSSIDENESEKKGVVRCKTYINLLVMVNDGDSVIIDNYTQFDVKSLVPEKLLNITLPFKTIDWYKMYIEYVNNYLKKENNNCERLDTKN